MERFRIGNWNDENDWAVTEVSDKNVLGFISTWSHTVCLLWWCCVIWLHFIDRKNVRIVFGYDIVIVQCTMSRQCHCFNFVLFFCVCLFLCMHFYGMRCSLNSHSPILFSGYIKFIDPSRTCLPHVHLFINESYKSWIFILIKWTSHFSTEKRAINTQIAYKIGKRSNRLVLIDFKWMLNRCLNGLNIFKEHDSTHWK